MPRAIFDSMTGPAVSVRTPALAFGSSRLLLLITAYAVLSMFPVHTIEPWMTQIFPDHNWIDGWVRWDAFWYESIVDRDARFLPQGHSNASFFPFYGWAAWVFSLPFQPFLDYARAFFVGAIVLSHAAFFVGLIGMYRVAESIGGADVAERSIWLMAFFPFSFFFAAAYGDALYFAASVWAFRLVQTGRLAGGAILAVIAALTRITGFVLIAGVVIEVFLRRRTSLLSARSLVTAGAILSLAPLVLVTYYVVRYGDPLAFLHARQDGWSRATGIQPLLTDIDYYTAGSLLSCGEWRECLRGWDFTRQLLGLWYFALVPIGVGLAVAARQPLGPGLVLWVIGTYLMALVNGLDGMGRFTSVLFPVFIALAMYVVRTWRMVVAVCAACIPFLLLFLGGFVRWRAVL